MEFNIIIKNKPLNVDKEIDDVINRNHTQLYDFSRKEFESIVQYDLFNIMTFYYSKMNAEQREIIIDALEKDLAMKDVEEILTNFSRPFQDDEDELYVPLSCQLLDKIADSRSTSMIFQTLFIKSTNLILEDWDKDDSYSNYLVILNAAYFKALSYKLHMGIAYSVSLNYLYGYTEYDDFIDSLYQEHEDDDWDYDIDLVSIDEMIENSECNHDYIQSDKQLLLNKVQMMENINKKYKYDPLLDNLKGLPLILHKTGIVEYESVLIDGFDCHFCDSQTSDVEYIIIYQKDNRIIDVIENEKEWSGFQRNIYYEDIKHNHAHGLVYIIYILDDDCDNIPIQLIESDKTYGRKYVFTEEETITFINGIVKTSNDDLFAVSPVQEWDKILREGHLTACMTESYAAKKVDSYLNGERFDADYYDDEYSSKNENVPKVKWVKSVDTTGFRNFCFDKKTFNFGQINLFYGANGSGKTSVLEAIEYGLTGEVRRVKDFKVKMFADLAPKVKVYDTEAGIHTFSPHFSKSNNKEIERVWYGVPTGRNKSNLNDNFNRFNAFDSEAAYKFIHESDNSEESFSSMFGNLMFGETIVDHEKKWQRFKKAFNDKYGELRNQLNDAKSWVYLYEMSLKQRNYSNKTEEIEKGLKDLQFRNSYRFSNSSSSRYNEIFDEMNSAKKYIDILISEDLDLDTFEEIASSISDKKKQYNRLIKQKKQFSNEISKLTSKESTLKEQIFKEKNKQRDLTKKLDNINTEINNWQIVQNVLNHQDTIGLAHNLMEELASVDRDIYYISLIEQRPSVYDFLNLSDYTGLDMDQIAKIEQELSDLKAEKVDLEREYKEEKKQFGVREQKSIELRKIGKSLINNSICPLCGYKYESSKELLDLIDNSVVIDNRIEEIINKIHKTEETLKEKQRILDTQKLITDAQRNLEQLKNDVPLILENPTDYQKILNYINSKDVLDKRKNEIVKQQTILDKQGFSIKNIKACQDYIYTDQMYLDYKNSSEKEFSVYLEKKLQLVQNEILLSKNAIEGYENEINTHEQKEELLKSQIYHTDTLIDNLNFDSTREIEEALENLKMKFFLPDVSVLRDWKRKFQEVYDKCELEIKRIEAQGQIAFEKQQLDYYKSVVKSLEPKIDRCGRAVRIFENMPTLSTFVEKGIKENIQQISKFFKWMHHSGEFEKLDIDESGIYAIRGMNHQIVRTYEMSTGQRSTIAMAVMFSLHIAAPDAPHFLLLDEPLATMDDTQVLNVLDILKSLAEQGTQIFFTTANGIMIKLFKECFKNTSYDYKEFRFVKRVNSPSEIEETDINDTKTIEELTLDDLTLDFNQFAMIREVLKKNEERLVSQEDYEKTDFITADKKDILKDNFFNNLNDQHINLLKLLLDDESERANYLSSALKSYPTYRTDIEQINDIAIDYYGETIIENDNPLPWIDDWYKEILNLELLKYEENNE